MRDDSNKESQIRAAEENLDAIQLLAYREKLDIVAAILEFLPTELQRFIDIDKELKDRRASSEPHWWFGVFFIFGIAIHYIFGEASAKQELTLGTGIALAAAFFYLVYHFDTYQIDKQRQRRLKSIEGLLYRWIANGGQKTVFWSLRDQINDQPDDYRDSDKYRDWWLSVKESLLLSITGKIIL